MEHTDTNLKIRVPRSTLRLNWFGLAHWLPSPGNVIFTLLVIGGLLWAQSVGAINLAAPAASTLSTTGIPYQGRLADANGVSLTGAYNMIFRLYAAASGGTALWEEQWSGPSAVQISDGLFSVMLGSVTTIPQGIIAGNSDLFLGISVGADAEMTPRVQLGSVPFAMQALTVPDQSITSAKLNLSNGLSMTGDLTVNGVATGNKIISANSTKDNTDPATGNMGQQRWTITTAGSPLVNWDVEESWIHFGKNLYFVQWTFSKLNNQPNDISVPANSSTNVQLQNWNTQEFASSKFANMDAGSYLTGVSTFANLLFLTNWSSTPTTVDFVAYNGVGGVPGGVFTFANPSSNSATVRSFSLQGFVRTP